MAAENIRIDRNVVYNINDVVPGKRYYEQSIEMLFFFAFLVQTNDGSLFPESEGVEYAIKASDFINFTKRSKCTVYANVPDWNFNVNILGTSDLLTLSNVFEHILWSFRWQPLPLSKVYTNQLNSEKRINIGETIISSLQVGYTKKKNIKERTFYVTLNEFFMKSLMKEFLTINTQDFPKLRGNRKNSMYSVFFLLYIKENEQRRKGTDYVIATYHEIKKAGNIQINRGTEAQIISDTVAKFIKYIDYVRENTMLDFTYQVENNNFILSFVKSNRNIDGDKQSRILSSNIKDITVKWLRKRKLPLDIDVLKQEEKIKLLDHLFISLFNPKNSNKGTEFERSLDWYCKHFCDVLGMDISYIKSYYYTQIDK